MLGGIITFYQTIVNQYNKLRIQTQALEVKLKTYPPGELLCVKNGVYTKWYHRNGLELTYITKKNRSLVKELAIKKYYSLQLKDLMIELQILKTCISEYQKYSKKSINLLDESSKYKEFISSHFDTFPDEVHQWMLSNQQHNTNHVEHLIHKTISGHYVRSKSEVIIANALFINKIPYKYECGLSMNHVLIFPDFTILHPKTMETIYWEHFGMIDNPTYSENAFQKLKLYASHGIFPSINLITTYETLSFPIDSQKIQDLIEEFFL